MLEYKFDTQLLIEGQNLNEDEINDYITENFQGDCLLAVGCLLYTSIVLSIQYHNNSRTYRYPINI